jgi:hypothetical protein
MIKVMTVEKYNKFIKKQISKLTPIKYNQFYWWRKFKDKSPLSSKSSISDRIDNGDFDFSHYWFQAQHTLIEMEAKTGHIKEPDIRREEQTIFMERYRRLLNDFERDEKERISNYKRAITGLFSITKEDLEKEMETFDGTLEELYTFIRANYSYKKNQSKRGRPKKLSI